MEVDQFFRAGIGVIAINDLGMVLAAQRSDVDEAWQAPQGGIEHGETPVEALHRELGEELGLIANDFEILAESDQWLAYELPQESWSTKTGRGQVHRWFLIRLSSDAIELEASIEFTAYRWVTIGDLLDRVWEARRPVYKRLADEWADHFAEPT